MNIAVVQTARDTDDSRQSPPERPRGTPPRSRCEQEGRGVSLQYVAIRFVFLPVGLFHPDVFRFFGISLLRHPDIFVSSLPLSLPMYIAGTIAAKATLEAARRRQ